MALWTKFLRFLLATAIVLGFVSVIGAACWLNVFGVPVIIVLIIGVVVSIPIAIVYDALELRALERR